MWEWKYGGSVSMSRIFRLMFVIVVALMLGAPLAFAQGDATVAGVLVNALSQDPIGGATVQLEEIRRETTSAADGSFSFSNVRPGTYHVSVRSDGYSARRVEVTAVAGAMPMRIAVDPELHFEEVLSVSSEPRSQFETFQPTSVLDRKSTRLNSSHT